MGWSSYTSQESSTGWTTMSDDLGPREAEAISKLLDLAKYAILAMLVGAGAVGVDSLI